MGAAVLVFRDDGDSPHCDIALANGDRVRLALDAGGLVVTRLGGAGEAPQLLFSGRPSVVAKICAGLGGPKARTEDSPLRILASAVVRIDSAASVHAAFHEAAASLS